MKKFNCLILERKEKSNGVNKIREIRFDKCKQDINEYEDRILKLYYECVLQATIDLNIFNFKHFKTYKNKDLNFMNIEFTLDVK